MSTDESVSAAPRWDALDGLRAVAVMAVMVTHTGTRFARGGFLGVDIFFVLSGFLITGILTREWDRRAGINFGIFYARRGLRLLPALWAVAGVSLLCAAVVPHTAAHATFVGAWSAMLYVADVVRLPANGLLGHTWSLSVEEQFYLIWPIVLVALLRFLPRRRVAAAAVFGAGLAVAVVRNLRWQGPHTQLLRDTLSVRIDSRADSLLIGCALGLLLSATNTSMMTAGWRRSIAVGSTLGTLALLILFFTTTLGQSGMLDGGYSVAAIAAALVILRLVTIPGKYARIALANPLMVGIGKISYGLYLWHFPLYKVVTTQRLESVLGCGQSIARVLQFLLAFPVAIFSWYFIETPFLRMKDRLGKRPPHGGEIRPLEPARLEA